MSQLQRQAAAAAAQLTARTRALAEARGLRLSSSPGLGSSVHASAATAASSGRGGGSRRRDGGGKAARKKHKFSEKLKRLVSEALDEDGNDTDICRGEEHTDYPGEMVVVAAGGLNLQVIHHLAKSGPHLQVSWWSCLAPFPREGGKHHAGVCAPPSSRCQLLRPWHPVPALRGCCAGLGGGLLRVVHGAPRVQRVGLVRAEAGLRRPARLWRVLAQARGGQHHPRGGGLGAPRCAPGFCSHH